MDTRTLVNTVITAAIVVVILPLLASVAAVCASFGLELTADSLVGMFGTMGAPHVLALVWLIAAAGIVATLVALLMNDPQRHA